MLRGNPSAEETLRIFAKGAANCLSRAMQLTGTPRMFGISGHVALCRDGAVFMDKDYIVENGAELRFKRLQDGRLDHTVAQVQEVMRSKECTLTPTIEELLDAVMDARAEDTLPIVAFVYCVEAFRMVEKAFNDYIDVAGIWMDTESYFKDEEVTDFIKGLYVPNPHSTDILERMEYCRLPQFLVVRGEAITKRFVEQASAKNVQVIASVDWTLTEEEADFLDAIGCYGVITPFAEDFLDLECVEWTY